MTRGITLETLGDLIDGGHTIWATCSSCRHSAKLDLHAIAELKGRDWVTINKRWPVKCSACGGRRTTVTLIVAGTPGMSR